MRSFITWTHQILLGSSNLCHTGYAECLLARSGWYYSSILTYAVLEEVTRHWRKLPNEELHYLNSSNIVRVIKPTRSNRQGMCCTWTVELKYLQVSFSGETWWRERPLLRQCLDGRVILKCKMNLKETGCEDMEWIYLAVDKENWTQYWTFRFHQIWGIWSGWRTVVSRDVP